MVFDKNKNTYEFRKINSDYKYSVAHKAIKQCIRLVTEVAVDVCGSDNRKEFESNREIFLRYLTKNKSTLLKYIFP